MIIQKPEDWEYPLTRWFKDNMLVPVLTETIAVKNDISFRTIDVKYESKAEGVKVVRYVKCISAWGIVYKTEAELRKANELGLSLRRF